MTSSPAALVPPGVDTPLMTVSEGEDVMVTCSNPNTLLLIPSLQWLGPIGNRLPAEFGALRILNITRSQGGEYRCVLRSTRNKTASTTVTITVECE